MDHRTFDMKYPPMKTRCGVYDSSPGRSILLKHKDEGFVPSTPMPAHDAPLREVRQFFVNILLEREMPVDTAKSIASRWWGNGLQLHIESFDTYRCWFQDKNAQVIYRDVHAIIRRESKLRQRQRDARRQRANLAKCEFLSFPTFFSDFHYSFHTPIRIRDEEETDLHLLLQCPDFS